MNEEVIIKVDLQGEESVDKLNKKLDQTGEYSEKATSEISKLRRELRDAKGDMLKYAEGTEQYNKALRRASDIQGRMKETNDIVKAGVRDLGATTKLVAGTINGLAGGFQVAQGAMALFGVENDAVLETMMKMQALMSITSGIAGFADGFDNLQDLMTGFKAQAGGAKDAVSELSKVSGEAADNMGNLAKEGAVIGSNLAGTTGIADKLGDALDNVGKKATASKESITAYQNALDNFIDADVKARTTGSQFDELDKKYALDKLKTSKEQMEASREMAQAELDASKAKEDLSKLTDKATNSLKSQLLTMGLWIAAIAAATYAITSFIEWINKVPEDVKVKIDVDTDVFKAIGKDLVNINKFVNDYRKASKDGNKERLEELEKFGKKEFNLNDARLKQIRDTTDGWKAAFKEYLKIAEDTYWNESIIKRKVEAQQAALTAKSTAIRLFKSQSDTGFMSGKTAQGGLSSKTSGGWTWEQLVEAAQKNDWAGKTDADLRAFGIPQQIIDELRKVILSNEIIKGLPKLRDVDMGTGIKPEGGGKQQKSTNKLDTSLDKFSKPDLTSIDNFYKPILDAEIKYTNEELVIMEDNNKERKGIYDDAIEDQIGYVIEREAAIQRDINNELEAEYGKKALLEAEVARFNEINNLYKDDVAALNDYARNKANYQNLIILADNEMSSLGDKITQADIDRINKKKQSYQDEIDIIDLDITAKNKEIDSLKAQLKEYENYPDKLAQITEKIAQLNVEITNSTRTQVEAERDLWQERIAMAKDYLDAISNVAVGIADIAQGNMDLTNAEYDQKIWANDEMIQSDEEREAKAYEIEMQRWEALKENFEMQKKMKEAQAWMDFASGSVGIWTAPGITSLAPFGYILAGIQQAALLATTIGNVKSIKAQQMLKPHSPGSGSSGGGSSANIALNPAKDALTSRDENLNTMSKSNMKDVPTNVVRVSEINDVQQKVKVRESNSSF